MCIRDSSYDPASACRAKKNIFHFRNQKILIASTRLIIIMRVRFYFGDESSFKNVKVEIEPTRVHAQLILSGRKFYKIINAVSMNILSLFSNFNFPN